MNKSYLGEFEELMLTMVGILKDEAYGNSIVQEVESQLDRQLNLSAVHVTLYRLEDKGLISSHMGGATKERGGRRKRYFELTSAGISVLQRIQEDRIKLWKLIPELKIVGI
jgi:PadR family transcriptional regulator, regulatory protein PadR